MKITNSMLFDANLTQLECYYKIIEELKSNIPEELNYVIKMEFDNSDNIQFIHPLFLVYILNFYELIQADEKYQSQDIRIILNIENLNNNVQSYIKTYLTQYIDCNVILVVDSKFSDRDKQPSIFTDKKILLYTTEKENNLTLLREQKYNFLPIIKIANNTFNEAFEDKDYWITNKNTGKSEKIPSYENRKIFYKSLQLETIEKGAYKNKSEKVWKNIFETYLSLTDSGAYITEKFQDLFREIVENIEKHIKGTNGYIVFYKDTHFKTHNQFEFIIADDYEKGFLSKYLETIIQEKKDELNEKVKEGYQEIIDDLINKDHVKVLKNIFDLNYVLSVQKERITKHFGLPLLLKILVKFEQLSFEKYQKDNLVSLKVYLNNDEKSFLVTYKNGTSTITPLDDNSIRGTYFHLSFPESLYLDNPQEVTKVPSKVSTKQYEKFLEKDTNNMIQNSFKKFHYYLNFEDLKNKTVIDSSKESIIVDYTTCNETSNFLRSLYSYGFIHEPKDILVVNYPIEEELEYLKLLCETSDLSKICNIAFLNESYPQVLLISGDTQSELFDINQMLSQHYSYNKRNFLSDTLHSDDKIITIDSNLFFTNENGRLVFLPFELFLPNPHNQNELLYTLMLNNFLELAGNYEKIHLDLKDNFHIKKFYYLKNVFENSQWIKLLAFDLAKKIKHKYTKFENIIFVGIEKYSSSFIAELEYLLDTNLLCYIVSDLDNESIIDQFDNFKKLHSDKRFIFIRPSVFESNIDNLIENVKNYEKYTLIQLTKDDTESHDWISNYNKNLNDVLELSSKCSMCFDENKPLYTIDNDKYNIKDLYRTHDKYKVDDKIFEVSWRNVVYFPHIERNTNHYLYYIRTTQFYKNNKVYIKDYFYNTDFKIDKKVPVILTSAHYTNSEFVSMINEKIFENDAIVHSISLNNKEQGYFSIDNLKATYQNKEEYYSFYFVDDAISSGEAFKYIYSILSSFFNDKFQAVFTLIDRTNKKDLKLFHTYYKEFYSYIKINIHPIKTGFENCYLCEREKTFKKIAIDSSLVTIKHTFQEKVKDLAKKSASEIEYEPLKHIDDLKNYLRMSSTEYIYQHINEFKTLNNIEKKIDNYYEDIVKKYFKKNHLNNQPLTSEIDNFLKVESRIALLKSWGFPKVYFFVSLRESIHKYIYEEIRKFTNTNRKNISIVPILTESDYEELKKIDNIKNLVSHYKDKNRTTMDYFSFLLSLGSFLGVNHILSYEVINYYYHLNNEIKKPDKYQYKSLLDIYPIAVKQLTTSSKDKSKYFERELAKFYKETPFKYTRIFSRIFGLFVENTSNLDIDIKIFDDIIKEDTIDEQVEDFKIDLENKILTKFKNINIKSISIDINEDIESPFIIDVLNDYEELKNDTNEMKLYLGASIKKDIDYDTDIEIKNTDEKYNIWCNFYKDFTTYIRITNSNRVLTPLGVIVIKHTNKDGNKHDQLVEHLQISRLVLAYQNTICKLFTKNNMLSAMRTKYDELVEKEHIEEKNKQISNSIHMINHTYRNYNKYSSFLMDIYKINDEHIDDIKYNMYNLIQYSRGIELHSILGSLNKQKLEHYTTQSKFPNKSEIIYSIQKNSDIFNICKEFLSVCSTYIKTNPTLSKDANYTFKVKGIDEFDIKYRNLCGISDDHIDSLLFELIFNIIKQNCSGSNILITIKENEIFIENSGMVIKEEQREEFFEYDETSSTYSFGLGLPTIRQTLSLFNIQIECINPMNKEYNCCFRIYKLI